MSNSRRSLFREMSQQDAATVTGGACSCGYYSYRSVPYYSASDYTNYKTPSPASFESAANHLDQVLLG
jgi:hypothetical protein